MRPTSFILITLCSLLPLMAHAQSTTNAPATAIENFELQTDTLMVKGFGEIGSVSTQGGVVAVRCKESNNETTNRKLYGISVALTVNDSRGALVVDYDELEPMISALEFLGRISYEVTPMPAFDAAFTTRSGFRIGAHSDRRQGAIQLYLQFGDTEKILLSPDQFTQFQNLITESKSSLDVTRGKSSSP
jgi:hypothetical protein